MLKHIMVLNCGSSSVKFNIFKLLENDMLHPVLQGIVEEIGNPGKSGIKYTIHEHKEKTKRPIADHRQALLAIFTLLEHLGIDKETICSVGHRIVHGGEKYSSSVRVDEHVLHTIRELIPIAPLHNPPNLVGLEESIRLLPDVPQVAVFDTAFHGSLPEAAYRYAIPARWYDDFGVRKFGFHGTSHMYVAKRAARYLNIPFADFCGITAHLGNGCSITKIKNGKSVDTSMGFTPLEGVIMGTRSGDIDPALISHVVNSLIKDQEQDKGAVYEKVMQALNKESGLKALAKTNMMQEIRGKAVQGDKQADTVIDIYAYRIAKYIGQYWATLPRADAIVFTAGLGENEGYVRQKILGFLENLDFVIDEAMNTVRGEEVTIARSNAKSGHILQALVIPTNEEVVIGYDTLYLGYLGQDVPQVYPFEK